MSSSSTVSPSSSAQPYVRPARPEDWEAYRDIITKLYNELKLKDVMKELERLYKFKATEKQYKTQLKKWNLDTKYIKSAEYIAIIKAKRKRERDDPGKQTKFILHGKVVDGDAITRFERRAIRKGIISFDGTLSEQEDVEGLACES